MIGDARGYFPTRQDWVIAARSQIRVIAALIRREMREHFGESRLGYLWAIIEPMLHLGSFVLILIVLFRRHAPMGDSPTVFVMTAILPYFLYYKLASYVGAAVQSNRALLNLPPVKPLDVALSRAILETATYLVVGFILCVGLVVWGIGEAVPAHPIELVPATVALVGFGTGLGLINIVIRVFIYTWPTIFSLVTGPLYLLSGIWFLPEQVPPPLRDYLLYNPIMHYVMWFRRGFYRDYNPEYLDRSYAIAWAVFVFILGLALLRVARAKVLDPP